MNLEQFLSVHLSFQYILTLKKSEAGGRREWGGHQVGSAGKSNDYQVDDLNSILETYSLESCPRTSTGIRNKQM